MGYVYLNCSVPGRIVIHSLFLEQVSTDLARVETWRVLRVQRCTANNAGCASGATFLVRSVSTHIPERLWAYANLARCFTCLAHCGSTPFLPRLPIPIAIFRAAPLRVSTRACSSGGVRAKTRKLPPDRDQGGAVLASLGQNLSGQNNDNNYQPDQNNNNSNQIRKMTTMTSSITK